MTGVDRTFRLLDARVGWDVRPDDGLAGVVLDGGALRLAPAPLGPDGSGAGLPALARGGDGSWWLGGRHGLLRLGQCDDGFRPWRVRRRVRRVAARGGRVAVLLGAGLIEVFAVAGGQVLARARVPGAVSVSLGARGDLVVVDRYGRRTELDPSGLVCRAEDCRPGTPVPPAPPPGPPVPPGAVVGPAGFCLDGRGCFDPEGRPAPDLAPEGGADTLLREGQYLSLPLDSGLPGCRWHRVRVDADVPDGTAVEIAVATTDGPVEDRAPAHDGEDGDFPAGDPHPLDWSVVPAGATDAALSVPAGRFGYLRLRLRGDGARTPSVYQVRLDLPRVTSVDQLPALYADGPGADFTERFVSIFDAALEEIDDVLAARGALLDPDALPDDALGWLAGLLGTGFEAEMDVAQRRALLRAAPRLFRLRGTVAGLVETLAVALGVNATVEELGVARPWGAVGAARLGSVRLFGRSRVRLRLGTSRLGRARVVSGGNPDHDAVLAGAVRVRVHVPAGSPVALVERVVRSQLPAPVVAEVSVASPGFVATVLRVGLDTVLRPPDRAVVGAVALGRHGVVAAGRAGTAERVLGSPGAFVAAGN